MHWSSGLLHRLDDAHYSSTDLQDMFTNVHHWFSNLAHGYTQVGEHLPGAVEDNVGGKPHAQGHKFL